MLLNVTFHKEINVPDWEYCNVHRADEPSKIDGYHCNFVSSKSTGDYCLLFESRSLFRHSDMILKCDTCKEKTRQVTVNHTLKIDHTYNSDHQKGEY